MLVDMLQDDTDSLMSYNTKQQVLVKDRLLGFCEKLVQACVAFYVLIYVFMIREGYMEYENAKGITLAYPNGDAVSTGTGGAMHTRAFSTEDIVHPFLENGNVFVTTRLEIQTQSRGVCEDTLLPCHDVADCSKDVGASCSENGFCVEPSWCSPPDKQPEVYKLETDKLRLWVKSSIAFTTLVKKKTIVYSNKMDLPLQYPEPGFNTFNVKDILLMCEPPVRFEEVSELGAAVEVMMYWKCNVDGPFGCTPDVSARRIDSLFDADNIGFTFQSTDKLPDGRRRHEVRRGIRIYFKTSGRGGKMSMNAFVLKASTGASLLVLAPIITDFIMLRFLKFSVKYRARKYIYSQDFSDFWEELEAMEGSAEVDESKAEDLEDQEHEQEDEEWRNKMDQD